VKASAGILVALSTILVIIGLAIPLFLNPLWVGFEQGRAEAAAWTGWTGDQVSSVTGAILRDLIVGPPDFAMVVDGRPALDEREREHMRDVRGVFVGFAVASVAAALVLLAAGVGSRAAGWFRRSVAAGAIVLAGAVIALGLFFGVAFDAAFDLFHRLFFGAGSYTFDPTTERLVQLFPERFWYETSIALGIVLLAGAALAAWLALRRRPGRSAEGGHA